MIWTFLNLRMKHNGVIETVANNTATVCGALNFQKNWKLKEAERTRILCQTHFLMVEDLERYQSLMSSRENA